MAQRYIRTLMTVVLLLAFVAPQSALGAKSEAERLQDQLADIQADLKRAGAEYDAAYWELDETDVRIDKVDAEIAQTEEDLAAARVLLGSRVERMYRSDAVDYLTVLLGATSFEEMVTRLDFVQRIATADADAIQDVEDLQAKLTTERESLEKERSKRAEALSALKGKRDKLQDRMTTKRAEYAKAKAKLDAVRSTSNRSGSTAAPGANGMIFPVQGVHYYSDTYGASRSGGRRTHQGTDIMSPRGTPCVAVLSGTVTAKTNGLGGKTIWLSANNGWSFYYAHLDSWAVTSGRVSAGQVIGYVGSTGNASASSPHLHFEIHPGGGGAVNPYPYLRAME